MMEIHVWTIQQTGEPLKEAQFTMAIPRTNKGGKETHQVQNAL
jgi:hypothetical protein